VLVNPLPVMKCAERGVTATQTAYTKDWTIDFIGRWLDSSRPNRREPFPA
jgi:hypothetical protein